MERIPFTISNNHGHEVSGLVYLEEQFLVFEIQVKKWSLFKQPTETVKAALGVIEDVRFDPGVFKDSMYLIPRKSELLEAVPGDHRGELRLRIAKRYREDARRFALKVLQKKSKSTDAE